MIACAVLLAARPLGLLQAACADRFRESGNYAWLVPWAPSRWVYGKALTLAIFFAHEDL